MIDCTFENGHKANLRHVVVDGILVKDNKILLIKRAEHLLHGGKYALPGGFLDRDERVEDAIKREVMEETGYETENLTLFTVISNPERGEDRQNVAFIYLVDVGEKKGNPDKEVESMVWYAPDQLPSKEDMAFDHYETLELYKQYSGKRFNLPFIR